MTVKVEVFVCVSAPVLQDLSAQDLAAITADAAIDHAREDAEFALRIVEDTDSLLRRLERQARDAGHGPCIVVSDRLVAGGPGGHLASELTTRIEELFRSHSSSCGLIALTSDAEPPLVGIDALVAAHPLDIVSLRTEVARIANRLWFKSPPSRRSHARQSRARSVEILQVESKEQLRACLALRAGVYRALGYLDEAVERSGTDIEMDGYDPVSLHFMAVDRAQNDRLLGTMRLIVPGLNHRLPGIHAQVGRADYSAWCEQISIDERDRIWRDRLNRPCPNALPILDSFDFFFEMKDQEFLKDHVVPSDSCELSRVIVAPDCRGAGVSRLLVNKAISVAKKIRRRYLLLECAPHHERMYAKYGFRVMEDDGERYYARAQRLDSWAVAMCREQWASNDGDKRQARPREQSRGRYALPIESGCAAGSTLLIESGRTDSAAIESIVQRPISDFKDIRGVTGLRRITEQRSLVARSSKVSLGKLMLAALRTCSVTDLLSCLRPVLQRFESASFTLVDPTGRPFLIDNECIKGGDAMRVADGLKRWREHQGA